MKVKKMLLACVVLLVGLIVLRFVFLPEPIQESYILSGRNRRYYVTSEGPFDTTGVVRTVVFNGFFNIDGKLGKEDTKALFGILLDSSRYEWGETVTAEFSKTLIYYDGEGVVRGQTVFSYDGQTYTYPSTEEQSKWGHLDDEGLKAVLDVIE